MAGSRLARSWLYDNTEPADFSDLKGIVDTVLARLNLADAALAPASHPTFHPGRSAVLSVGGVEVGVFGEVHPDVCEAYGLGGRRVCLAEFMLDKLLATAGQPVRMRSVSTYPAVYEDLAIVIDQGVPAARVRDLIAQAGGSMLRRVELFDVYRGEQLSAGKKSLAYALTYQADDRTLNAEAVERLRKKIVRRLEQELGAVLRA
jgi:phenylalanyl-tRNA synthetase beta chain